MSDVSRHSTHEADDLLWPSPVACLGDARTADAQALSRHVATPRIWCEKLALVVVPWVTPRKGSPERPRQNLESGVDGVSSEAPTSAQTAHVHCKDPETFPMAARQEPPREKENGI